MLLVDYTIKVRLTTFAVKAAKAISIKIRSNMQES